MKFHLTIIFLLITPFLFAQVNLVPNPSFEIRDTCDVWGSCPTQNSLICIAKGWSTAKGSPDYYNSCDTNPPSLHSVSVPSNYFGYQYAATGNAYAGFFTYIGSYNPKEREWIECKLNNSLNIGIKYFISFKVSLADSANCAANNIGALFSTDSIWQNVYVPQSNFSQFSTTTIITDTNKWTLVTGEFIADSAYQYILIGNFYDYALTDSIFYPTRPSSYWVDSTRCFAYYYIDDICVSIDSNTCFSTVDIQENFFSNKINIFPSPATDELTIDFALTDKSYFELFNMMGAKRKAVTLDCGSQTIKIDLTDFDSGVYFYSVVDRKGNRIKTGKLVVIK